MKPRYSGLFLILSMLFAIVPFAFASLRLISTGRDARYFWPAGAAFAGMVVITVLRSRRGHSRATVAGSAILVLVAAVVLATVMALWTGATSFVAVFVVALGFGLCETASFVLRDVAASGRPVNSPKP